MSKQGPKSAQKTRKFGIGLSIYHVFDDCHGQLPGLIMAWPTGAGNEKGRPVLTERPFYAVGPGNRATLSTAINLQRQWPH